MVPVQKWPFFQLFFSGNIGKENVLYDILERKKAFVRYKKKNFKKSKNWHCSKWITHSVGPKMAIFPIFFLKQFKQENVCYDILKGKIAFLSYKNKKFKKSKNSHFFKGVNPWFLSKNGHFSNFFFLGNIGQENVFDDILEQKNAFLGYKNKKFKKSINWHFSKWFWSTNDTFPRFFF